MRTYAQILIELLTVFCIMTVTLSMNCRHDCRHNNKALPAWCTNISPDITVQKHMVSFDVNLYLHDKWHEAPHALIYQSLCRKGSWAHPCCPPHIISGVWIKSAPWQPPKGPFEPVEPSKNRFNLPLRSIFISSHTLPVAKPFAPDLFWFSSGQVLDLMLDFKYGLYPLFFL